MQTISIRNVCKYLNVIRNYYSITALKKIQYHFVIFNWHIFRKVKNPTTIVVGF